MTKLSEFFVRIGLPADTTAERSVEFLGQVQEACVLTIPYENLDILAGRAISLDGGDLYRKIVTGHRGGYCFELNALLHHMLAEMGFSVKSCLARFLRGESEPPFRRHRIVIVTLDGFDYLMDIGVGQIAPRFPLKLAEGEIQEQNGETYRFMRDEELGWVLEDLHHGKWRRYISFTTERQYEVDFTVPSFWCEAHPESPFNKAPMLAIKTKNGRKTIDGRTYKEFCVDELTHMEEDLTDARLEELYKTEFGIQ